MSRQKKEGKSWSWRKARANEKRGRSFGSCCVETRQKWDSTLGRRQSDRSEWQSDKTTGFEFEKKNGRPKDHEVIK